MPPPTAAEAERTGIGGHASGGLGGDLKPSGFHDQGFHEEP